MSARRRQHRFALPYPPLAAALPGCGTRRMHAPSSAGPLA